MTSTPSTAATPNRHQFLELDFQPDDPHSPQLYDKVITQFRKKFGSFTGLVLASIGAFILSLQGMIAKLLQHVPTFQLLYLRSLIMLMMLYYYLSRIKKTHEIIPSLTKPVLIAGTLAWTASGCYIYGIAILRLTDALVLMSIQPITLGFLAAIFLKEKFGVVELTASLLCVVGVAFITKPSYIFTNSSPPSSKDDGITDTIKSFAIVLCLIQPIIESIRVLLIKKVGNAVNHFVMLFTFVTQIVLLFPLFFLTVSEVQILSIKSFVQIAVMGFFNLCANVLFLQALQEEKAAVVSITLYSQIFYSGILEAFILNVFPDGYSCIGAIIIVSSCASVLIAKSKRS